MSKQKKQPKLPLQHSGNTRSYALALLLITALSLSPVLFNDFINLDDPQYVTTNPVVKELNGVNLKLIFTEPFVGNYQPLTMLSYLLEYNFFDGKAGAFHFFSLLFHLLNTLLVFFIFLKITGNSLVAFITALLFGIHPLHVESVAWVSARKDLLYTLFFLASLWFYLSHVRQKDDSKRFYVLSMLFFILSLLSKAQAVILPVTFFLADYLAGRKLSRNTVVEKVPFFALSLLFGALAYLIQKKSGAVQDFEYFSVAERLLFSCYGLLNYFYKTLLPINLSCFYPYPETQDKINTNWVYISPIILAVMGFVTWRYFRHSKEMLFGLGFFMVTILLVLQLIPVGDAVMADRYTYLSSLGLFFIAGHYFSRFLEKRRNQAAVVKGTGLAIAALLCILTFSRSKVWKDSITLYTDALSKYPAAIIHNNLGVAYIDKKMDTEALEQFSQVVALKPNFPNGFKNRALTFEKLNDAENALKDFNSAVQYFPTEESYLNRARMFMKTGKAEEAMNDFNKILSMNPNNVDAYYSRAQLYGNKGMMQQSLDDMNKVLSLRPDLPEGYGNRGIVLSMMGKFPEAIADFNKALELNPKAFNTYVNRSLAYKSMGNYQAALQDLLTAKQNGNPVDENHFKEVQALAAGQPK